MFALFSLYNNNPFNGPLCRMTQVSCYHQKKILPSVLWHCWLGVRKSIRPVKNWVVRCWHGYLSRVSCKWYACGPADATASPSLLASLKTQTCQDSWTLSATCFRPQKVASWSQTHMKVKSQVGNQVCNLNSIMEFGIKQVADRFELSQHVKVALTWSRTGSQLAFDRPVTRTRRSASKSATWSATG